MPIPAPTETDLTRFPDWVPSAARTYVEHAFDGRPLRHVAAERGCSASTILRHVRRIERLRDDPLVDEAIERLAAARLMPKRTEEDPAMSALPAKAALIDDATLAREGRRVLRRLCEADAFLAVGQGMPQAAVLRGSGDTPTRTATLPRDVAQAMVLKDWLSCFKAGRVTRYRITDAGRAALKRMLGDSLQHKVAARGMAEAPSPFLTQHMQLSERVIEVPGHGDTSLRVNLAESPLGALARKRDKDGKPFLPMPLVVAGERLREDFERAQMGPRVGQNWDRFLAAGDRGSMGPSDPIGGSDAARQRVSQALRALGPGLGDVVLRVCCFLEGLEAAEKRMGWSARSGKIVLRIALQRLAQHYDGNR
ncbi:DUF6456 domain-containing protein [Jannaschia formosa]|uniref:DUF6456 domain-containing protein n=1 Tax=Jannaschia formosa TaxID=2259592 RepID=UPI000E1B6463|nr:DUF6456 domain-containing protein [Jannaschia formosa]TFL18197.1 helix-turn-helix domain-containing protein [Jannaschia formosa]